MIKNVRFNTFIILLILNLNISASAFDEATYTNGMFGNSFFSINLGSGWTQNSNMLIGDIVTASYARNNMADFVSINANYSKSTDPLLDPLYANSAQELMQNKRKTLESAGAYNSFSEDSFTTNGGYKVHVLSYTQNAAPSPQHYHFFIDATSSQYSGGQANWFAIDVDFTSTTFPSVMTGISFEEAKAIIQSIDIENNNLNSSSEDLNLANSDQDQSSETSETPSIATSTSGNVMSKWVESGWMGVFFEASNGWIFHPDLGWLYAEDSSADKTWLYADKKGWLWTSKETYPYLYSHDSTNWIYVVKEDDEPTQAYDYNPGKWSLWQELTLWVIINPNPDQSASKTSESQAIEKVLDSEKSDSSKIKEIAEIIKSKL